MTTFICLVRHGETAWNAEHRVQGQFDVPLNAVGEAQARRGGAGARRAGLRCDLLRATCCARGRRRSPRPPRLALPVELDAGLRERHYGIFEQLTYAEVKVKFPEDYRASTRATRTTISAPARACALFPSAASPPSSASPSGTAAGASSSSRTAACSTSSTGTSRAFHQRPARLRHPQRGFEPRRAYRRGLADRRLGGHRPS